MIIGILSRFACNIFCFLYPAYASYKALSTPSIDPAGDILIERWLMYWAVVGTWTGVEALAGWLFTWLPFYSLFKTVFFLYLSLPQTEGSTYVYRAHLAPLFYQHEEDIDAALNGLRSRATETITGALGMIWEKVRQQLNIAAPAYPEYAQGHEQVAAPQMPPPSFQDPAGGAMQQMYGLFNRYAIQYLPAAITAIQAATNAATARTIPAAQAQREAQMVTEAMSMPIPSINNSDPRRLSRTSQYASTESFARMRHTSDQFLNAHPRSASNPQMPPQVIHRNSDESRNTMGSNRSSRSSLAGAYGEMSGYETINREDAVDAVGETVPEALRPGGPRRGSSWFGWGGQGEERAKAE
ncbi:TB2/DP1, HVA22 family-domain-containing protein [Dioszegia hungarica]|uniref:Protein YOP1 n=1 Tax=Dioszegia hungarica TaxID=4972 RepID=A0AA38H1S2_9TREE|nr:TB2/DP1, HVA22 family-domain-containing protein [Dioszegia hungarica]KAI9633032.1 TB2/DP1, HVA22 family-domain-containing protein [Dioszegia hungarica]